MRRLLVLMVGVTLTTSACASLSAGAPGSGSADAPAQVPSTIYMDPPLNRMSFSPAGEVQPGLTSSEAAVAFEKVNPDFLLPADATAQLGLYTAAVGDGTYRYQDRLAWGFSWYECAQPRFEPAPGTVIPCTAWLFLDANTGKMLEATWQKDA